MKVDEDALLVIRDKTARAHENLVAIEQQTAAYNALNPEPYRVDVKSQADGTKHLLRLYMDPPMPVRWSVILGEVIHDLHSALEQAVYQLIIDYTGHARKSGTGFPIVKTPAEFTRRGRPQIRGVGPGPEAFIAALQPYRWRIRRVECMMLRSLRAFWNQDKHRAPHPWGARLDDNTAVPSNPACRIEWVDGFHRDGAIIGRVFCDPGSFEVKVHGGATFVPSVIDPARGRIEHGLSLLDFSDIIGGIVDRLVDAIGHQQDPIPL